MEERFDDAGRSVLGGLDAQHSPVGVPVDGGDRMDQDVDLPALHLQQCQHRVDDEGHVVGHDVDDGVAAGPPILVDVGVVDLHQRLGRGALGGQLEMADRRAVEIDRILVGQVLGSDAFVVQPHQALGFVRGDAGVPLPSEGDHGVEQSVFHLFGRLDHGALPRGTRRTKSGWR